MSTDRTTGKETGKTTALSTRPANHDGWTLARQATFLRELAASHCIAQAARAAGMSRQSAYALRARSKGEPFDLAWTAAFRCRFDALAEAAMERAFHGVEVPHFHKGELIHTSRKFDERLTVALLAMRESFVPPSVSRYDRAAEYRADDFGKLIERVEQGPETWAEQNRQELEELYGPRECEICGSADGCDCEWEEGEGHEHEFEDQHGYEGRK